MSWFTNFEKSIAGKLHKAFTGAKELADHAGDEVIKAEEALATAKQKAANLSKAAHEAALAALAKAQQETARLVEETKSAEKKAIYHDRQVMLPQITSTVISPIVVIEEKPVITNPPSITMVPTTNQ